MNKLIIGTANFGLNYGQGILKKKVDTEEIKKIILFCKKKKINFLDTAFSYKNERYLKSQKLNKWNIITKISIKNFKNEKNIDKKINLLINKTINNFKVKNLYGVLFHDIKEIEKKSGKKFYSILEKLKKDKKIKKIGVSVYNPKDIDKILKNYKFDIIQCPLSIFDRRFINTGYLKKMKKKGIEIHIRSIFLQGLLLMQHKLMPKKFNRWNKIWNKWSAWNIKNKTTKLETCVNFINQIANIDKVVVGITNKKQLQDILKYFKERKKNNYSLQFCKDTNLLDPRKWDKI